MKKIYVKKKILKIVSIHLLFYTILNSIKEEGNLRGKNNITYPLLTFT